MLAALYRDRSPDYLLRVVSLSGISVPAFWLALLSLYVLFYKLAWLPGGGRLESDRIPPPDITGIYTVDALLAGHSPKFRNAVDT